MRAGWDNGLRSYASLQAFYEADEARKRSGEMDFGVWWWDGRQGYSDQWRVSAVEATGEVYALCERPLRRDPHAQRQPSRLVVLGVLGGPDLGYSKAEGALQGWEDVCGGEDSLQWCLDRIRLATGAIAAVEAPAVKTEPTTLGELAGEVVALLTALDWHEMPDDVHRRIQQLRTVLARLPADPAAYADRDARALDELARILRRKTWPSGSDFLNWTAEIVRESGRDIS